MQRIHLIAPAGNLPSFYQHLGVANGAAMMALFQEYAGPDCLLTADLQILDAREDELRGGRTDDELRARDITEALADDSVTAILAVRGGAWFTRILPKIDFSVLDRRANPITVFGFSELTPLINIVAHHPMGRGFHDMGPAFLVYGLKRAALALGFNDDSNPTPHKWMLENLRVHVAEYFQETVAILLRRNNPIVLTAELVRGRRPDPASTSFVGGNLTVLSTLIGSPFEQSIDPTHRWLLLEDFNDKLERFDRFLAHFTLAGFWHRCSGLLIGDFHRGEEDLQEAILSLLDHHLPPGHELPVLTTSQVGHTWPMSPLPLHQEGCWQSTNNRLFEWRPAPMF